MESTFYMYLSMGEGILICILLSWEIFWLSRMYKVLWNMPTAQQVQEMVEMIKRDRESIKESVVSMSEVFICAKDMFLNFINPLLSLNGLKQVDSKNSCDSEKVG